jgi:hypothetical protein
MLNVYVPAYGFFPFISQTMKAKIKGIIADVTIEPKR